MAFIVAMQRLPATQRAALLLRDVLAYSPAETAQLLDTSVAAANSLLQRARTTISTHHGTSSGEGSGRPLDATEQQIMQRFVDTWQRRDIPGLAALLAEDAILRRPPQRAEFAGRDQITDFFATVPAGGRLELIDLGWCGQTVSRPWPRTCRMSVASASATGSWSWRSMRA